MRPGRATVPSDRAKQEDVIMGPPVELERDGGYRTVIDRTLRSWLSDTPTRLAADATRPFDVDADRLSGRFLLLGVDAVGGERAGEGPVSAAASVELLRGQALLNARAAGLPDTDFEEIDRTHALLASDYLHSLAYAGLEGLDVEPPIGDACYRTVSAASRNLAAYWSQTEGDGRPSVDDVPIDPIVTAAAGDLAGILARADEDCRRALRATGAVLGIARWHADAERPLDDRMASLSELLPEDWPGTDVGAVIDAGNADELLGPLPDSSDLTRLRSVAESVLNAPTDRLSYE